VSLAESVQLEPLCFAESAVERVESETFWVVDFVLSMEYLVR
jgi:hypothetical protein